MERKKSNKEITEEFANYWKNELENITNPYFAAKLCYEDKDLKEKCIRVFESELNVQSGIYVEFFDWKGEPDTERTLYYLPHNPEWKTLENDYERRVSQSGKIVSFAVKINNLEKYCVKDLEDTLESINFTEEEDWHFSTMTIRDFYCIINQVPMSNRKQLNELITKGIEWKKEKKSSCCQQNQ